MPWQGFSVVFPPGISPPSLLSPGRSPNPVCFPIWNDSNGLTFESGIMDKKLEIQYAKKTTLKMEICGVHREAGKDYVRVRATLEINKIPIAESFKVLNVGDSIEFSHDQGILSYFSYGGLTPLVDNVRKVINQLLPRGDEDGRGVEGISSSNQRSDGEHKGDPEGDL